MNSIKIPRSSVKCPPIRIHPSIVDENLSSESSEEEFEAKCSPMSVNNLAEDDRLAKLAEWQPETMIESSESDEDEAEIAQIDHDEFRLPDKPIDGEEVHQLRNSPVEDLLVTYVHHPIKIEPSIPQIDGQTDLIINEQKSKTSNLQAPIRKRRRLRGKRTFSMESPGRTLLDYFQVIKRSSTNFHSSPKTSNIRPDNYFDNCISIDDDDDDEEKDVARIPR